MIEGCVDVLLTQVTDLGQKQDMAEKGGLQPCGYKHIHMAVTSKSLSIITTFQIVNYPTNEEENLQGFERVVHFSLF